MILKTGYNQEQKSLNKRTSQYTRNQFENPHRLIHEMKQKKTIPLPQRRKFLSEYFRN